MTKNYDEMIREIEKSVECPNCKSTNVFEAGGVAFGAVKEDVAPVVTAFDIWQCGDCLRTFSIYPFYKKFLQE